MARAGQELFADADALIPVPLHWRRQWARRLNQSTALAAEIAKASGVTVKNGALLRTRATQQQVGLSKSERAANMQGAFKVAPDATGDIRGKRLILVDDVLTSGATAEACTKTLLRAGAAHVDVLIFARVVTVARTPI